ncbi:geobacillin-26 family protein [Bacillus sp. MCCB 382]|uniref:geobacillin-26 family protein n=1 Tax=Bacillus sp. MCCB 382 TaxID=2860197 RepID=UPI001C57954B|nr:geobacillin-26 family protein [Bacillus sp. MCCB 382]
MKKAMVIVFLLGLIPMQVNAESTEVITKGDAGGFYYKVIKEGNSFTWKIGDEDYKQTIKENSENDQSLDDFRVAVNEADGHRFTMIISAVYFAIVVLTTFITYKKRKHIPTTAMVILACLAGGALFAAITNYIDMQAALQDAGYYYGTLLAE